MGRVPNFVEEATIPFRDTLSPDSAVAIVRYGDGSVLLCLSLSSNGDVEVGMSKVDAEKLIQALTAALGKA